MAYLQLHTGPQAGTQVDASNAITIGRMHDNDVVLSDSGASRYHARITQHEEIFFLKDLSSSNGTLLQGQPLLPERLVELDEGDEIQIGSIRMTFHLYQFFRSSCELPRPSDEWIASRHTAPLDIHEVNSWVAAVEIDLREEPTGLASEAQSEETVIDNNPGQSPGSGTEQF